MENKNKLKKNLPNVILVAVKDKVFGLYFPYTVTYDATFILFLNWLSRSAATFSVSLFSKTYLFLLKSFLIFIKIL